MQIAYYIKELRYAGKVGATLRSKLNLARNTIRFHLANWHARTEAQADAEAYAVRLSPASDQTTEIRLHTANGDLFIFYEIFLNETYFVPPAWRADIHTIIDLGSHIGLTTLYLNTLFPQAKFICLEPNARNFALLQQNLTGIAAEGRALLINGAAGCVEHARFNPTGVSWQGQLGSEGDLIDCYSISQLLEHAHADHVDLIKIDIEGAEATLLSDDLDWLRQARLIMIELHHPYSFEAFAALMAAHDFTVLLPESTAGNHVLMAVANQQLAAARS